MMFQDVCLHHKTVCFIQRVHFEGRIFKRSYELACDSLYPTHVTINTYAALITSHQFLQICSVKHDETIGDFL